MNREQNQLTNKMATPPTKKLIITMAIPPIISMTLDGLYSTLDTIFVAAINNDSLIALSIALPFTSLIIAFAVGTANGCSSLIARYFGAQQPKSAIQIAQIGLVLALMNWLLFSLIGHFFSRPFIEIFTQNTEIIAMSSSFIKISTFFSLGFFIETTCSRYLQAMGKTKLPMIAQLTGAVANCIIDPILIFGFLGFPKLGLVGAAIGNVTGQTLAMIVSLAALLFTHHELPISFKGFKIQMHHVKSIYKIAIPNIAMLSMPAISVSFMNVIAAQISVNMVGVLGIIYKIQNQIEYPIIGLSQATLPIFSFNFGAKNKKRLLSAYKFSLQSAFVINLLFVLVLFLFPENVLTLFSSSSQPTAKIALFIASLSFLLNGVNFIALILFQSIGKSSYSLVASLLKQLLFLILFSFTLSTLVGEIGFWMSFPLSEIVAALIFIPLSFKKINSSLEGETV